MHNYWHDKTIVVTGAAQGQGAEEVLELLSLGANVIAVDIHQPGASQWDGLTRQTNESASLTVRYLDVADPDQWLELANYIRESSLPLHGLVNNAGITLRKTVSKTTPAEWRNLMVINLDGAFYGIHYLSEVMEDGGSVVNISSTAGLTGYFSAAYTASKWGLRGLTRASAIDLADRNIRVNTICPGLVETPMMMKANAEHNVEKARLFHEGNRQATLLSRGAQPCEIAKVVVFLLGPDSSFINAADVPVDGGMTGGGIYWRIGKMTGDL